MNIRGKRMKHGLGRPRKKRLSSETCKKIGMSLKGRTFSVLHCNHISDSLRGKSFPYERRNKMRATTKRLWEDPLFRKNQSEVRKGKPQSVASSNKKSATFKRLWSDVEFARKMSRSWHTFPTKPERLLKTLLQETFPGEYAINTHAEIMVLGGKVPDFVNINGQKKLIELWGDYWHRGQNPQDRIDYFKQFGHWDTLIIWEHELKDVEFLQSRLVAFNQRLEE